MAKKKNLTPEEKALARERDAVASLFHTIVFETLPWMTRAIIENDLNKMSFADLHPIIEETQSKLFVSLLAGYTDYLSELQEILGVKLIVLSQQGRRYIDLGKLDKFTAATELHFFEGAHENKDEQERRTIFLAVLHCARCLMRLSGYLDKNVFEGVALETLLFCISTMQATHAGLVVEAARVKKSQQEKPKHFAHRQTMVKVLAQLLQKRGKFRAKEAGKIFNEEYPDGLAVNDVKFSYRPISDEILYQKPDGSGGEWGLKDFQDMMTEAKKTPKN